MENAHSLYFHHEEQASMNTPATRTVSAAVSLATSMARQWVHLDEIVHAVAVDNNMDVCEVRTLLSALGIAELRPLRVERDGFETLGLRASADYPIESLIHCSLANGRDRDDYAYDAQAAAWYTDVSWPIHKIVPWLEARHLKVLQPSWRNYLVEVFPHLQMVSSLDTCGFSDSDRKASGSKADLAQISKQQEAQSVGIAPAVIRLRDAPVYLGTNKNTFEATIRPYLPEINIGEHGRQVAFRITDLDAWIEDHCRPARLY